MKNDRRTYMKAYRADYKMRVRIVKVTLDMALFEKLDARASLEGLRPASLARELIEAGLLGDARIPEIVSDELRTLRFLIRNVASNVNQMSHHSNVVRRVADEGALFDELHKLENAIESYTLRRLNNGHDYQIDAT